MEIYNSHCFYFLDIANDALQEIPEDQVLCDLSEKFVGGAMYLGVELGLTSERIVQILAKDEKDLCKQNLGVLKEWKFSKQHEATILVLMKAFQWVDGKGLTFLRQQYG